MKIQYLGTSATERIPSMFCECENCKKTRELGGKNKRTRSQALIDDLILIDFPADTFLHFEMFDVPFKNIRNCLITHSHMDHLYTEDTVLKKSRFAHVFENKEPLVFYSDKSGYDMIENKRIANGIPMEDYHAKLITSKEEFNIGEYKIIPLKAVHDVNSTPLIYIIEKDGKTCFYSTDTSEYCEETMDYLKNLQKPIDLITLDCTYGNSKTDCMGHMDLTRCAKLKDELIKIGAASDKTRFVLTHFSHNGDDVVYDEFSILAEEKGFITAYDGMVMEI